MMQILTLLLAGISVYLPSVPVVADKSHNIVAELCVRCDESGQSLDAVGVQITGLLPNEVRNVRLISTGTMQVCGRRCWAINEERKRVGGGSSLWYDPVWTRELAMGHPDGSGSLLMNTSMPLRRGDNRMYVSLSVDGSRIQDISKPFSVIVSSVIVDGVSVSFRQDGTPQKRIGISVRQHGDDGVCAYRIPGLVTTTSGTIVAVYDIRHSSSLDLQNDIDIGVCRSTDGGRTWTPMQTVMDMGCYGGLPEAQNGVGDPSVLVDKASGRIYIVAAWTHGLGAGRAWNNVGQGFSPEETAQIMIVSSDDDGIGWSAPRSITPQIKHTEWYFTLQGPGSGICMKDGTLVFPVQHIGPDRIPSAGIMYSKDGGWSWQMHESAMPNTTESSVAELPDGSLMLNMRNNRKTGRVVCTTRDLGRTWQLHASSGKLIEPVCMASLLAVPASNNITGQNLLLFSNPAVPKGRHHLTIKLSLDDGYSWNDGLLLDEEDIWGYSCLSMIDNETVGILYESSGAQLLFQAIKLKDLEMPKVINTIDLPQVADEAYSKGVSAPFFGDAGGSLVLAGGANFPDKPLLEGGSKKVYADIWTKSECGKWMHAGTLPDSVAYGATFKIGNALVLAGGNVSGKPSDKVYKLEIKKGKTQLKELGALPDAIEQAGWTCDDKSLYLVGGVSASGRSDVVYVCDKGRYRWKVLSTLPVPLVQPVAFVSKDKLYVWGGFDPATSEVYSNGWCLDIISGVWSETVGVPDGGTFVGASGITLPDGRLLVLGGVNKDIFAKALHNGPEDRIPYLSMAPAAYCFRDTVWIFDPKIGVWQKVGTSGRTALAGAGICVSKGSIFIAGGEIKPGVRSPNINKLVL